MTTYTLTVTRQHDNGEYDDQNHSEHDTQTQIHHRTRAELLEQIELETRPVNNRSSQTTLTFTITSDFT